MFGSPRFAISKQELGHVAWVSLLFGVAAFVTKFIEAGGSLDWGGYAQVWGVVAAGLAWVVKTYLTDTQPPLPLLTAEVKSRACKGC